MSEKAGQNQGKEKEERKIYSYYDVKDGRLARRLKKCPRCGAFMAFHKGSRQRWACGGCSYTEFSKTPQG